MKAWQERTLLSGVALQPRRACGGGEADLQEGQGASDNVLVYGHSVLQDHCENHVRIP